MSMVLPRVHNNPHTDPGRLHTIPVCTLASSWCYQVKHHHQVNTGHPGRTQSHTPEHGVSDNQTPQHQDSHGKADCAGFSLNHDHLVRYSIKGHTRWVIGKQTDGRLKRVAKEGKKVLTKQSNEQFTDTDEKTVLPIAHSKREHKKRTENDNGGSSDNDCTRRLCTLGWRNEPGLVTCPEAIEKVTKTTQSNVAALPTDAVSEQDSLGDTPLLNTKLAHQQ